MVKVKGLILCAGYATRLYPLTLNQPKPLLKIAGKPIIEYIIKRIEEVDEIDTIYIVTNNKFYTHFTEWKNNFSTTKKIEIINDNTLSDEDKLGAIKDILFVINKKQIDEDLMIIAGDNLFEYSLKKFTKFFKEKEATVVAARVIENKELAKKYGIIQLDGNKKIIDFQEKPEEPKSTYAATCAYLVKKDDIHLFSSYIKDSNNPDAPGYFMQWAHKQTDIYAFLFDESWFDIGDKEQLRIADEEYKKR